MVNGDMKIKERKSGEDGSRGGMIQPPTKKCWMSAEGRTLFGPFRGGRVLLIL